MKQYLDVLNRILLDGEKTSDRTGTGTIQLFDDTTMVFDMKDGFPLLTTKKMAVKNIIRELLWFLSGDTNVRTLQEQGCHIWDGNYESHRKELEEESASFGCLPDEPDGDLGPIYGHQWRHWRIVHPLNAFGESYIDQIDSLVSMIRNNPTSRRLIVSAWNVADIDKMALPPCHVLFQCHVREGKYLDMKMYQRSADMFLGVPFNIASYAFLLHMLAQQTGLIPGKFIHILGNAHIYLDHIDQVKEQLSRSPYVLPRLELSRAKDIFSYTLDDFRIEDYHSHPAIKAHMSV